MNSCNFVGRLCHMPELRQTTDGKSVLSFSLAVKRPRSRDVTDFLRFVAWEKNAEYIARYAGRGDLLEISSAMAVTRQFKDRTGKTREVTEFALGEVKMLSSREAGEKCEDGEGPYEFVSIPNDGSLPF